MGVVVGVVVRLLVSDNFFVPLSPSPLPCSPVPLKGTGKYGGSEDISIHLPSGKAFVSSSDHLTRLTHPTALVPGAIMEYDVGAASPSLTPLPLVDWPYAEVDFQPHGISLFQTSDDLLVFVVVHPVSVASGSMISKFVYRDGKLHHLQSWSDPSMISVNDVHAYGENEFFFTNDHGRTLPMGLLEDIFPSVFANGSVFFFDGSNYFMVEDGLQMANGVKLSLDGKVLYVTETIARSLRVYTKQQSSWQFVTSIYLDSYTDNIEIDTEGGLWIGSHPRVLHFVVHSFNPHYFHSPSQVFHLTFPPNQSFDNSSHILYEAQQVYLDLGEELSGSSVGGVWGKDGGSKHLVIGSVASPFFLHCSLTDPNQPTL